MKVTTVPLASYSTKSDWMIGAKSWMIDRAVPYPEEIRLRPAETISGALRFWIEKNSKLDSKQTFFDKIKQTLLKNENESLKTSEQSYVLDLRLRTPSNWAHAFTNHLPIALLLAKHITESDLSRVILVLPEDLPTKLRQLFLSIGFQVLTTKREVSGNIIKFKVEPWLAIRGIRNQLIKELVPEAFVNNIKKSKVNDGFRKLYLARKNTRTVKNGDELDRELLDQGYRKVYLEEYSLFEQISILAWSNDIVAVHGASLGPLIMRAAINLEPYRLVEIFSPAHVSNVYRVIVAQQQGRWVGVRGEPWPALFGKAPDFSKNLNDFSVDIDAVRHALTLP